MKILLTAKQRSSVNALAPIAWELISRGHDITIYATGNLDENAGFNGLPFERFDTDDYKALVQGHDAVVVGLSGYQTPDGQFQLAAQSRGIPTLAVLDQNSNYHERLGNNPHHLPTLIAVMNDDCIKTAEKELAPEMAEEFAQRCRVVGWSAFDHYAAIKNTFTEKKREDLLLTLKLNPEKPVYFHATQNIHPRTAYLEKITTPEEEKKFNFCYELEVTDAVFRAAADLSLRLTVKSHPGEEGSYTKDLVQQYGFQYLDASACNTQQLILASYSITAGRSSCLTEATLLDRNVGAILPEKKGIQWRVSCPAVTLKAIPSTHRWKNIRNIVKAITSSKKETVQKLARRRKNFSVDGMASPRVADLVERLG